MHLDGISLDALPPSAVRDVDTVSTVVAERPKRDKSALWKLVKQGIGRDVLSLPVQYLEPLSFLQRLAEDLEYSSLLDRAADVSLSSADRAALVAAFLISHYSSTRGRTLKPFNPLLGETFELVLPERRLAIVAEQVSHHPPVSAVHAVGDGWTYSATQRVRTKVHATTVEAWPCGEVHIEFTKLAKTEHYVYEKVHCYVNNLVMGSLWLDNAGSVQIREVNFGETVTKVEFKKSSSRKNMGRVAGNVCLSTDLNTPVRTISGSWISHIDIDGETVWRERDRPGLQRTGGHEMTQWGWNLNCPVDASADVGGDASPTSVMQSEYSGLPCTDSRFRPDQRLLEVGKYKEAQKEKKRVEEMQRQRREMMLKEGCKHVPRWFDACGNEQWRYNNKYFATKVVGWPKDLPRIHDTEN